MDYSFKNHLIDEQFEAEQAFRSEYAKGEYSFEKPFVKVNPYLITPLTAIILFSTDKPEAISITVKGKNQEGDFNFSFPETKEHVIPVLGLYPDYENTVILRNSQGQLSSLKIKTGPVPPEIKEPEYIKTTPEYFEDNVMFLSPSSLGKMVAYDGQGDLRWYINIDVVFDVKRINNGHILVATERLIELPYVLTGIYEMSMIGKIYHEYRLPGGVHHDYIEIDDDHFVILTQDLHRNTVEDVAVLIDRQTGDIIRQWDLAKLLPTDAGGGPRYTPKDWFHNNAVWYDKPTNSLTFSGRNLDVLANIDFETGEINWLLGDPEKWPEDFKEKYFFTPEGDDFDWFYAQHSCIILPDGDVLVLDNGAWRSKYAEKDIPGDQKFTRGVRYSLDLNKRTVKQVWQYGKERGSDFFSPHISNVDYYGENHYLIHSGDTGNIKGVPCVKPPIFYLGKPEEKDLTYYATTVEVKDNEVKYEIRVPGAYYRAKKMKLYDKNDTLIFGKGSLLGSLGVTKETKLKLPKESHGIIPVEYEGCIFDETDRFKFQAMLPEGSFAVLVLCGSDVHTYQIPTVQDREMALCVGSFQESNKKQTFITVSKENLIGEYDVYLYLEGQLYSTSTKLKGR
ncbi:MAG: aryl-sulfate sulfotransferase [Peptococcales bacterium]